MSVLCSFRPRFTPLLLLSPRPRHVLSEVSGQDMCQGSARSRQVSRPKRSLLRNHHFHTAPALDSVRSSSIFACGTVWCSSKSVENCCRGVLGLPRGFCDDDGRLRFPLYTPVMHTSSCSIASPQVFASENSAVLSRRDHVLVTHAGFFQPRPLLLIGARATQAPGCSLNRTDSTISATYPWYS